MDKFHGTALMLDSAEYRNSQIPFRQTPSPSALSFSLGGAPLNMGAHWIHGITNNPIYELADEYDLLEDPEWKEALDEENPRFYEGTTEARLEDSSLINMEDWVPVVRMFHRANDKADFFYQEVNSDIV